MENDIVGFAFMILIGWAVYGCSDSVKDSKFFGTPEMTFIECGRSPAEWKWARRRSIKIEDGFILYKDTEGKTHGVAKKDCEGW